MLKHNIGKFRGNQIRHVMIQLGKYSTTVDVVCHSGAERKDHQNKAIHAIIIDEYSIKKKTTTRFVSFF